MKAIWDGFLSAIAALFTLFVCGLPGWAAFEAVEGGLVPQWIHVPLIALGFICVLLTFSFTRKAFKGISPSRSRRR
jgi:hypothetical protein